MTAGGQEALFAGQPGTGWHDSPMSGWAGRSGIGPGGGRGRRPQRADVAVAQLPGASFERVRRPMPPPAKPRGAEIGPRLRTWAVCPA